MILVYDLQFTVASLLNHPLVNVYKAIENGHL